MPVRVRWNPHPDFSEVVPQRRLGCVGPPAQSRRRGRIRYGRDLAGRPGNGLNEPAVNTADATTRVQRKNSAEGQLSCGVQAKALPNSDDPMGCAAELLLRQGG